MAYTEKEFNSYVREAFNELHGSYKAIGARTDGYKAYITFNSHSGKQKWTCELDFNGEDSNCTFYTGTGAYATANGPRAFVERIQELINKNS